MNEAVWLLQAKNSIVLSQVILYSCCMKAINESYVSFMLYIYIGLIFEMKRES